MQLRLTYCCQTQLQILTAVVKLFLKKPGNTQALVQKVLQAATAENDNPDIRDRAYVYWRLLSGDLSIAKVGDPARGVSTRSVGMLLTWKPQTIVLSVKPTISTTMTTLPSTLLEQLLSELSTLASVYHKPPESFVGKGRFGADEIQRAAIQEQRQNAAENPIAASMAAANGSGGNASRTNVENLLDIDFDGAAPASHEQQSTTATPERMASPAGGAQSGGMADMMSMFDAPPAGARSSVVATATAASGNGASDLMNDFDGLNLGGSSNSSQSSPAAAQLSNAQIGNKQTQMQPQQKDSGDLLDLL